MDQLTKTMKIKNAALMFSRGEINLMQYFDLVRHLLTIILVINMIGCAKSSDPATIPAENPYLTCSELAGTYDNAYVSGSTLVLTNYCNMTENSCGYVGSFTPPNRSSGDTDLTIDMSLGGGCMNTSIHKCKIELKGMQLGILCDGNAESAVFNRRM